MMLFVPLIRLIFFCIDGYDTFDLPLMVFICLLNLDCALGNRVGYLDIGRKNHLHVVQGMTF